MPIATGLRVRADLAVNMERRDWKPKFAQMTAETKAGLKQAVEQNTIRLWQHAVARAPVQKGVQPTETLKRAIRYIFFDNAGLGWTGSVFVGKMVNPRQITRMDIKTRQAFGKKRTAKMPIYVEFGTVTSGERPFLLPALEAFYPRFEADCLRVLGDAWRD